MPNDPAGSPPIRVSGITAAACLLALAWLATYLTLAFLQYQTGNSLSLDLGFYARSLWGFAHGQPINPLSDQHSLALDAHYILYALAPLAHALPSAQLLISAQALALCAGGLALYHIAARRLSSPALGLGVEALYFVYPLASDTMLADVHPMTLAAPFLLLGLDRLDRLGARDPSAWALLAAALACREEIGLQIALVGAYSAAVHRRRAVGLALVGAGLTSWATYVLLVRPALGSELTDAAIHLGSTPFLEHLSRLPRSETALYLAFFFVSLGGLPLLSLRFTIAAALPIAGNLVAGLQEVSPPTSHYVFLALPFLMLGVVDGLARIQHRRAKGAKLALALALMTALVTHVAMGRGPGGGNFASDRYAFTHNALATNACLSKIPRSAAVLAPFHLTGQLADRPVIRYQLSKSHPVEQLSYALLLVAPLHIHRAHPLHHNFVRSQRLTAKHALDHGFEVEDICMPYFLLRRK